MERGRETEPQREYMSETPRGRENMRKREKELV